VESRAILAGYVVPFRGGIEIAAFYPVTAGASSPLRSARIGRSPTTVAHVKEKAMFTRLFALLFVVMAATLVVVPVALALETFEGKVLTTSADKHLTIRFQDDQKTFVVNDATKITLDGENARWEDIRPGFVVTVNADRDGDQFVARSVMAFANE
jgi:hypothetical protein